VNLRDLFSFLADALKDPPPPKPPPAKGKSSEGKGKAKAAPSSPASADNKFVAFESPDFRAGLKSLFQSNHTLSVGGMHLIGLNQIKAHFKDEWPKRAEKVRDVALRVIERHMGPQDIFTCYGEMIYIIVFGALPLSQAEMKCAIIAEEISRKIFGEGSRPDLVEVAATTLDKDGRLSMQKVSLPNFLNDLIGGKKAGVHSHDVASPSSPSPPSPSSTPSSPTAQETGAEEHKTPQDEPRKALSEQELLELRRREAEALRASLPPREAKLFSFGELSFVYRPMWLVKKKVTSAHTCVPARITSEGTLRVGGAALLSSPGSPVNAEYDLACLQFAAAELQILRRTDATAVIILPIHFFTLTEQKQRSKFLERVAALPEADKKQFRFELIAVPPDTPSARIGEAMSVLLSISNSPLLRVRLDFADFNALRGIGAYAVGFDILNYACDEKTLIKKFGKFAEGADKSGFKKYAHGLKTRSLIVAGVSEGFDYIDGDPIYSITDCTQDNSPFDLGSLYGLKS